MPVKKNFLDRFTERVEDVDAGSRQAYILRLVREHGFLETVFNVIEEGVLVIDRKLRIRYFNRAARELLALPSNLGDIRVSQLLQGVDWRRILRADEDEWLRVARQEFEILYPVRRFLQFYLVPYPEDTHLAAVILHDVTESRERAMDDLKRETGEAVSMLAAGVAHEIGNPLNSLYLNLQMLEKETPEGEGLEMIRNCKAEVERLDSIIHGFLSALRPGKPSFAPVDATQLLVEVLKFMRPEIEARRVEVVLDFMSNMPFLTGDKAQLKQLFYNVIRNAVQAMPNGGRLTVSGAYDAEYLSLEFSDSGVGIDSGQLGNLFKAFSSGRSGGNGIGMMVVERICREHGAEFGLHSLSGRGTAFEIRFPLGGKRVRLLPGAEQQS